MPEHEGSVTINERVRDLEVHRTYERESLAEIRRLMERQTEQIAAVLDKIRQLSDHRDDTIHSLSMMENRQTAAQEWINKHATEWSAHLVEWSNWKEQEKAREDRLVRRNATALTVVGLIFTAFGLVMLAANFYISHVKLH